MQTKNSFDRTSVRKLTFDTLILFGPQVAVYVLEALKGFNFGQYEALAGLAITTLIYVAKRYMQGEVWNGV